MVGDARRKTFFLAEIQKGNLKGEPELLSAEELALRLEEEQEIRQYAAEESVAEQFPSIALRCPTAARIAAIASQQNEQREDPLPLEPHYLRAPYITTPKSRSAS